MKNVSQNKFKLTLNFVFTVLLIVMLSQYFVVYGQNIPWTKYPGNPVLDVGPPGSWDDMQVGTASVIFENDTFKMWHAGDDGNNVRIGYATSLNGATWTKDTIHSPVLNVGAPGEWDDEKVYCPSVVFVNGNYHMWYSGVPDPAADTILIGHATSLDGLVWNKDPDNPVLEQSPPGSWDSYPWFFSCVIFENDTFHLWYSSYGNNQGQIGYATTTNPNGKNWTKYSGNPVLSPTYGSWDWSQVIEPSVATYNGTLYMFYRGGYLQGDIGFATSTDKVNWFKDPNPCLMRGSAGSWDGYSLSFPNVIYDGNEYKMWYNGVPSSTGAIKMGLATTFTLSPDTLNVPGEYSKIQEAIDAANNGDIVLVAEDTYYENINFRGKAITVASHFLVDSDTSHISNTIINGSQPTAPDSASVVTFRSGEDTTSIICGFTITGGTGTRILNNGYLKRVGGGVFAHTSSAKIQNNIIVSNAIQNNSDSWGGGICCFNGNYVIENNTIKNNEINSPVIDFYSLGGGIYTYSLGYVRIKNNKIIDNSITAPEAWGGGIIPAGLNNDNYFILNNLISGNTLNVSTGGSGGIDIYNHSPTIENNIIVNNSAPRGGGAVIENAIPIFSSNTIAYNTSTVSGGGLDIVNSNPLIMNCIVWGNDAPTGPQISGLAIVVYSDVEGGWTGEGNINDDPLFVNPTNGDFTLQDNVSPCLQTGTDSIYIGGTMYYCPPFCIHNVPRPSPAGTRPDIGACENEYPVGIIDNLLLIPEEYSLAQNYPNPFNPSTKIKYGIPERTFVELKIYDILGREVGLLVKEEQDAGYYELNFNAVKLSSGIYLYRLQAGDYIKTKKMILLK